MYDGTTKVIFKDMQTSQEIKQSPEGTYTDITLTLI
jgi:hypothetical protein